MWESASLMLWHVSNGFWWFHTLSCHHSLNFITTHVFESRNPSFFAGQDITTATTSFFSRSRKVHTIVYFHAAKQNVLLPMAVSSLLLVSSREVKRPAPGRGQWIRSALPGPAKSALLTASSSKMHLGRELIARYCRHNDWLWLRLSHHGWE